jgi:hypothetical protein
MCVCVCVCVVAQALRTRLGYLAFLQRRGACGAAEARCLLLRQPRFLAQRFGVVLEDESYLVFNKPFDTKLNYDGGGAPSFPEGAPAAARNHHSGVLAVASPYIGSRGNAKFGVACEAPN